MESVQIDIPESLYNSLKALGYQKKEIEEYSFFHNPSENNREPCIQVCISKIAVEANLFIPIRESG